MKIGLLAYHSAINFGATLQLLSTYRYLLNKGHEPVVINWIAEDLEAYYNKVASAGQLEQQKAVRRQLWNETSLCHTSCEVAEVIKSEAIEAVVIGSDAVVQYHTLMERLTFPCRTVIGVRGVNSDGVFPNAFWADWTDYLDKPVPVAVISASSQDSKYCYFLGWERKAMEKRVMNYKYLSVRDSWTQDMMKHITCGRRCPDVTPDPVFAFSQNASAILPSREDILARFNLPEKYIVMSFINSKTVHQRWIERFAEVAKRDGVECVMLPFAHAESFGRLEKNIPLPLSPVDWYALIKYSCGYVGHNMHPIVVSLHNDVPFFCFDNYGTKRFNGLMTSDKSSKIRHILERAGLAGQRVSCISRGFVPTSPDDIYAKMKAIDHAKVRSFGAEYLAKYNEMMADVLKAIGA